jgi:two-component system, NtrC family, response regulator HydG
MSSNSTKRQIVVVDEDSEIQDLISAYFAPKNFEVISFTDADVALKESLLSGEYWGVLLTDLHFPKTTSGDFTEQLKKNLPNLPVILITHPESAETAVLKGAYDLIVKPIHFAQLRIAVERALNLNELKEDISELREKVKGQNKIIGRSPKFLAALDVAKRVASSVTNIFITGESGTGKEVFAKFIHHESKRKKGPFIAINCSAIPENLLESELFGHAKGAFTGAHAKKDGLFAEAEDGTLFLDEIGDLSLVLQAKLLRVLQDRTIRRVGENQNVAINCRIISATHKDLSLEVREGRFREDLYFRLNVIPINIPPLRERPEDLIPLAESFLRKFALVNGSPVKSFSKAAIQFILDNHWRGNVRELENSVERAVVLCNETEIALENFMPLSMSLEPAANDSDEKYFSVKYKNELPSLDEVIHQYIEFAVQKNDGAKDKTARALGIDRKTLYKRMRPDTVSYIKHS